MWGKLHRPAKPLRRQIKVVAPAAVTVSLPLLQPRRYDQDNETIDAIDVENTTDRRQFRAGVLFLYGSERELCNPARTDHALLWEGTDDIRRWLSKGETGQLLLGRWLEDENNNRVFWFERAYGVSVGGQEVSGAVRGPPQQTRVTDKNRRTLLFQLRLTTTPPIPQGIVTQNYKLSWSGGLEPQGSLGVDPSAEIAARPETTQKQQPTTVHSDARPVPPTGPDASSTIGKGEEYPTTKTVRKWRKELLAAGDDPLETLAYVEIRSYLPSEMVHALESGRTIRVQPRASSIHWRTDWILDELDELERQWRLMR